MRAIIIAAAVISPFVAPADHRTQHIGGICLSHFIEQSRCAVPDATGLAMRISTLARAEWPTTRSSLI